MQPSQCTDAEIAAFCCLVRQGDEVDPEDLEDRARKARALVFLYVDRVLIGVAAIKRPEKRYRDGVFRKAGVPNEATEFELELGWVFVREEYRDRHYSRVLSVAAITQTERLATFATTKADNAAMQKTLEWLKFERIGKPWPSNRRPYNLALYVRRPTTG